MSCASQLATRSRCAARSLKYTRTTMRIRATTSAATKDVMRVPPRGLRAPSARTLAREARPALLEEGPDAFGGIGVRGLRGDGLALEDHLRLEGAEGVGDQALGGAVGAGRPVREALGDLHGVLEQALVRHHLVH